MRRLVVLSLPLLAFVGVAALAACDPDLTVKKTGGDAAPVPTSTTKSDGEAPPPADAGSETSTDAQTENDAAVEDAAPTGHVIDGTNDFTAGETFTTTSSLYTAYISWDAKSVYFGMNGDDIGKPASDQKWVLVYIGAAGAGTTTGINYNAGGAATTPQQPTLPFSATHHVRLKTDLSYVNAQSWSGSAWVDAAGVVPDCEKKNQFVECRVARASLGNPTSLKMHMNMIKEKPSEEWTYAGVPSISFTDGADKDYTKGFDFNLDDTAKAPNTYTPQ